MKKSKIKNRRILYNFWLCRRPKRKQKTISERIKRIITKKSTKKKEIEFQCNYCEKSHSIYKCESLLKLEPVKRLNWVKEKKLCFVCLQKHGKNECKSKYN